VTLGEPSGIGPELALKAWAAARGGAVLPPFAVAADAAFLEREARRLGLAVPVRRVEPHDAAGTFREALPVVDAGHAVVAEPGRPSAVNATAVIASIETAARLVREHGFAGMVTSPIAKHVLQAAGFAHPGHTEFLGALAVRFWRAKEVVPVMLLWSPQLAVVPVTIHIPLAEVPRRLSIALIVTTGRIVARDFINRFGIARPRLAVTGLNPHAGESGTLGFEDQTVVAPAIERLRAEGIAASGPHPADTLFHPQARKTYDVALTMYHDQALIPIKTIAFDEAVNVTLGLPFVRTSPDHGTAFDIAGRGVARPDSFFASLTLAARLAAASKAVAASS
jgi:4-hydroxythreonine-4-phosphate dehydrogenase